VQIAQLQNGYKVVTNWKQIVTKGLQNVTFQELQNGYKTVTNWEQKVTEW
jgi:hypothetical protein